MPAAGQNNTPTTQGNSATMYEITRANPTDSGEYSDQEILDLVNYFEISRAELQNVRINLLQTNRSKIIFPIASGFLTCTTDSQSETSRYESTEIIRRYRDVSLLY